MVSPDTESELENAREAPEGRPEIIQENFEAQVRLRVTIRVVTELEAEKDKELALRELRPNVNNFMAEAIEDLRKAA